MSHRLRLRTHRFGTLSLSTSTRCHGPFRCWPLPFPGHTSPQPTPIPSIPPFLRERELFKGSRPDGTFRWAVLHTLVASGLRSERTDGVSESRPSVHDARSSFSSVIFSLFIGTVDPLGMDPTCFHPYRRLGRDSSTRTYEAVHTTPNQRSLERPPTSRWLTYTYRNSNNNSHNTTTERDWKYVNPISLDLFVYLVLFSTKWKGPVSMFAVLRVRSRRSLQDWRTERRSFHHTQQKRSSPLCLLIETFGTDKVTID